MRITIPSSSSGLTMTKFAVRSLCTSKENADTVRKNDPLSPSLFSYAHLFLKTLTVRITASSLTLIERSVPGTHHDSCDYYSTSKNNVL